MDSRFRGNDGTYNPTRKMKRPCFMTPAPFHVRIHCPTMIVAPDGAPAGSGYQVRPGRQTGMTQMTQNLVDSTQNLGKTAQNSANIDNSNPSAKAKWRTMIQNDTETEGFRPCLPRQSFRTHLLNAPEGPSVIPAQESSPPRGWASSTGLCTCPAVQGNSLCLGTQHKL